MRIRSAHSHQPSASELLVLYMTMAGAAQTDGVAAAAAGNVGDGDYVAVVDE